MTTTIVAPATLLTLKDLRALGAAINKGEAKAADRALAVYSHPANADRDWFAPKAVIPAILAAYGLDKHPEAQKDSEGKFTNYGAGFNAVYVALRSLIGKQAPAAGVIRVSLSGEGGATVTFKPGDHGYAEALAFHGACVAASQVTN